MALNASSGVWSTNSVVVKLDVAIFFMIFDFDNFIQ
jgi:hypothetical protein